MTDSLLKILNVFQNMNINRYMIFVTITSKEGDKMINKTELTKDMKSWILTLTSIKLKYKIMTKNESNEYSFIICNKESNILYQPDYIMGRLMDC